MEVPLSPLELARRARSLYADREALVDGGLRLSYRQFFERSDRWSSALQSMGVKKGDRVLFGKYSGSEIKMDGEELLIMREDEILGIIERAGAATGKKGGK